MESDELRQRKGKRRFTTATLLDGTKVRLRSMLRSEQRKWHKCTKKEDGSEDESKQQFSDDVLLAMTIVDDEGNPLVSVEEAFQGFFDDWDTADTNILINEAVALSFPARPTAIADALKKTAETPGNDSSGGSAPEAA